MTKFNCEICGCTVIDTRREPPNKLCSECETPAPIKYTAVDAMNRVDNDCEPEAPDEL